MRTIVILFAAATSMWCAEQATRTIEKRFPLTGSNRSLFVCTISGSMKVTASDSNEVHIVVNEKLEAPTKEKLEEMRKMVDVVFTQDGGEVRAGVKGPWSENDCSSRNRGNNRERRRWDGNDTHIRHDFTVSVPRNAEVNVGNVNGSIELSGTTGEYKVHTVNGSIHMEDVEGAGEVNTVNGSVQVVYKRNPTADTRFKTVNGKLDLYFQPTLNADFHMKTVNGQAYTDFDMTAIAGSNASSEESRGMKVIHRRGSLGDLRAGNGGPKFSTETVNGSILIHSLAKGRP